MCKGRWRREGGLNVTTIHQNLRNVCNKVAHLKSFNFATSKEPNPHSFWATGLILVLQKAEFCLLQSYRVFLNSRNLKKNYTVCNFSFLGNNAFSWKKMFHSKRKIHFERLSLILSNHRSRQIKKNKNKEIFSYHGKMVPKCHQIW